MTNQYKFAVIIRNFFKGSKPVPLGRWQLNNQTNLKIDLSNEDHCGTCSEEDSKPKNLGKGNVDGSNINKGILDQWYKIEYEVLTKSLPDDRIK